MQDIFSDLDHERVANRLFMYTFFSDFRKKILSFTKPCLDDSIRCVFISRFRLSQIQRQSLGYTVTIDRQYLFFVYLPHKNQRCTQKLLCNVYTNGRPPTLSWSRSDAKVGTSQKSSFLKAAAWCLLPLLCPSNRKLLSDGVFICSFIRLLQ